MGASLATAVTIPKVNDDSASTKRANVRTSRRSFLILRRFFGAGDSRRRRKRKWGSLALPPARGRGQGRGAARYDLFCLAIAAASVSPVMNMCLYAVRSSA